MGLAGPPEDHVADRDVGPLRHHAEGEDVALGADGHARDLLFEDLADLGLGLGAPVQVSRDGLAGADREQRFEVVFHVRPKGSAAPSPGDHRARIRPAVSSTLHPSSPRYGGPASRPGRILPRQPGRVGGMCPAPRPRQRGCRQRETRPAGSWGVGVTGGTRSARGGRDRARPRARMARRFAAGLLAVVAAGIWLHPTVPAAASACSSGTETIEWTGRGTTDDRNDPRNWRDVATGGSRVPGAADFVCVPFTNPIRPSRTRSPGRVRSRRWRASRRSSFRPAGSR